MSVDTRVEVIPASGQIQLANGNFIFLLTATLAVTVQLKTGGSSENFTGLTGGLQVSRVRPWDLGAVITGTAGTVVTFIYGYTKIREDNTIFSQQIATIAGLVAVAILPASTLTDAPNVALPNAAQTAVFPANLVRRRIGISIVSTAVYAGGTVFARKAGGANNLVEINPGQVYSFDATYGVDIRNDSGGALSALIFEEA